MAARSKDYVCGRSPAEIVASNPTRGMDVSVVSVVCCQVEISATSWSLVQRSPTHCGASQCDLETSWMRRPWPTGGCHAKNKPTNGQKDRHGKAKTRSCVALRHYLALQYLSQGSVLCRSAFLNRRAAARYQAPALIIPGRERFSWCW